MNQINYISKAYVEKEEEEFRKSDMMAFVQGKYIVDALLCTVGNMFGGEKVDFSYPEQPYSIMAEEEQLSEDEIQRQREAFIASLKTMETNFKLSREEDNKKTGGVDE